MSDFSSMDVSASGLHAQRVKMDVIANNIANASTTRTEAGGPYKKQQVIFRALSSDDDPAKGGVEIESIVESDDPPKKVYDPTNPDAGEDGMVAVPDINVIEEMVDMISATRAYEANIQAVGAAKAMASKALEIGR